MRILINKTLGAKFQKGTELYLKVDKEDVPLQLFWRKQLEASEIDKCITVLDNTAKHILKKTKGKGK